MRFAAFATFLGRTFAPCWFASSLHHVIVHEVMAKQTPPADGLVSLSVRVTRETAEGLKRLAEREYRPVAAELRRLIEERVASAESAEREAA